MTQLECDKQNSKRSQREVENFLIHPPKKYVAYAFPLRNEIGTWIGQKLGKAYFGMEWKGNMGDLRQSVYITGINGKKYYGVYYKSNSDLVRFREVK